MTLDLQDRLRDLYADRTAHLPTTGPGLLEGLNDLAVRTADRPVDRSNTRLRVGIALGAAAAVAVLAFAVSNRSESTPQASTPENSSGTAEAIAAPPSTAASLAPVETLPLTNDVDEVPVTAQGTGPSSWYRLAPDLDIAWYLPGNGPSMFCWRTPTEQDCAIDPSTPNPFRHFSTAGGQTLVIATGDGTVPTYDLALDDGTVLTAPIDWDEQIGWGVARFEIPAGDAPQEFLPVVTYADGTAVSPTVPAASPLTFYQWLPELAFAERQTADGVGTEFCWRTTSGIGCILEEFESPAVGIVPTGEGAIFLVRPALVPIEPPPTDPGAPTFEVGPNPTIVTVTLSDGSTQTVDVEYEQDFGVGHAQITLPSGVTVATAVSS